MLAAVKKVRLSILRSVGKKKFPSGTRKWFALYQRIWNCKNINSINDMFAETAERLKTKVPKSVGLDCVRLNVGQP